MTQKLQKSLMALLCNEPFYAHYILQCKINVNSTRVPTMGVCVDSSVPTFEINSTWASKLSDSEFLMAIKHEVLHLVLGHSLRQVQMPRVMNVAMDCAINQFIANCPPWFISLEMLERELRVKLEPKQTSDYYYAQLKSHADEIIAKGIESFDDHSGLEEMGPVERAILGDMARKAARASAGNLPQGLEKFITTPDVAKLPWRSLLRNMVLSIRTITRKASYKRINRRFKLPVPGVVKERKFRLGVCTDSSGSVSDQMYAEFISEILALHKLGIELFLVDADSAVQNAKWYKPGDKIPLVRYGNGGTLYGPALARCDAEQVDAILYFGDMDSADSPAKPSVPVIWVISGSQNPPADFGKILRL